MQFYFSYITIVLTTLHNLCEESVHYTSTEGELHIHHYAFSIALWYVSGMEVNISECSKMKSSEEMPLLLLE